MHARRQRIAVVVAAFTVIGGGVAVLRRTPEASSTDVGAGDVSATRAAAASSHPLSVRSDAGVVGPVDPRIAHLPADLISATLTDPLILTGRVSEADGSTPIQAGAACRLAVEPTPELDTCRVMLDCGSTHLYGDPIVHPTSCLIVDGRVMAITDEATTFVDRDPAMAYSAESGVLRLSDDRAGIYREFSLSVELDDPDSERQANHAF